MRSWVRPTRPTRLNRPIRRAGCGVLVALILSLAGALGLGADSDGDPLYVSIEVGASPTGASLPDGFLGFSIEVNAMHRYLGRDANALNPVFLGLVRALDPGGSPVLRIGGDSTDHSWLPLPGAVEPVGVSYAITPNWLLGVRRAAAALHARLILGVNLAAGSPELAAVEARALLRGIGRTHISGLELGNEPDVYTAFAWYRSRRAAIGFARGPAWTQATYQSQFTDWAGALPRVPLAGPAYAYPTWMAQLPEFMAAEHRLGTVTFHRYPLRACGSEATGALAATIPHLLADSSSIGLAESVAAYAAEAHAAGRTFRLDELNSASCGGAPGVSDTFASALWICDTLFGLAAVGVDGVNIHTLPGAAYAPFSFTEHRGVWHARVAALYYGLLLFREAFPTGARLLPSSVNAPGLRVWSTRGPDGTVRTMLINENAADPVVVNLREDALGLDRPLSVETLSAPSLASTSGVSLGGASFADGTTTPTLAAPQRSTLNPLLGVYQLTVAPASAVLLSS